MKKPRYFSKKRRIEIIQQYFNISEAKAKLYVESVTSQRVIRVIDDYLKLMEEKYAR